MERGLVIRKRPLDPCFEHGKAALAAEVASCKEVLPFNDPPLPDLPSQTICWKVWIQGLIATSSRWQEVWQEYSIYHKNPLFPSIGLQHSNRSISGRGWFFNPISKLTPRASQMRAPKGGLDNVGTMLACPARQGVLPHAGRKPASGLNTAVAAYNPLNPPTEQRGRGFDDRPVILKPRRRTRVHLTPPRGAGKITPILTIIERKGSNQTCLCCRIYPVHRTVRQPKSRSIPPSEGGKKGIWGIWTEDSVLFWSASLQRRYYHICSAFCPQQGGCSLQHWSVCWRRTWTWSSPPNARPRGRIRTCRPIPKYWGLGS